MSRAPQPAAAAPPPATEPADPSDEIAPGRGTSRRRLLVTGSAAVAGLAVGAGGRQLAHALAGHDPEQPNVASPGEELMVEHGVLKRLLLAYRAIGERLSAGKTVPAGALTDAAQIISDYVESFHEGLEEGYVFPRVAEHQPQLIRTLLIQHDRGRHLTAAIQTAAAGNLGRPATRTAVAGYLRSFVRMYEPHEAWEDTVVYPTLRAYTSQRTLDALAERFADLETRQYGDTALQSMLGRVSGVEQQLGIHDLASFTPDPL